MIDKALYVAMTGASATLKAQASVSNNLANANTVGFQATLSGTVAAPVAGEGLASRVSASHRNLGVSAAPGSIINTGNSTDVALKQGHWLAVQAGDGGVAYTRAGDLRINANGLMTTGAGQPVLDQSGAPIAVPPHESMQIGDDGMISFVPLGQPPSTISDAGRMQVVAADTSAMIRGDDGLMRAAPGTEAPPPAAGSVMTTGALENSNVDSASMLVSMIQLARQFEMQVRVLKAGDDNARASNSLLSAR